MVDDFLLFFHCGDNPVDTICNLLHGHMVACLADLDYVGVIVLGPGVAAKIDLIDGPDLAGGSSIKNLGISAGAWGPINGSRAGLAQTRHGEIVFVQRHLCILHLKIKFYFLTSFSHPSNILLSLIC